MVDSTNRSARLVMYRKLNMVLDVPLDKQTPTCCVNALSYIFPSTAFQHGMQLPDFLSDGEHTKKKSCQSYLMNKIDNSNNSNTE